MFIHPYDYAAEASRFSALVEQYADREKELAEERAEAAEKEFARGGETIVRGFYNPSPLEDAITEGRGRGSLTKVFSLKTTKFIYSFDAAGRIMTIESVDHGKVWAKEYIINRKSESLGFLYDAEGRLTRIAEERYADGKLTDWSVFQFFNIQPESWDLDCDQYSYQDGALISMTNHQCHKLASAPSFAMPGLAQFLSLPEDGVIHRIWAYGDFEIRENAVYGYSLTTSGAHGPRPTQVVKLSKPIIFSFAPARSRWK